ncbi:MAG: carbon starvation protein A [Planctomycetota bacterium]
MSILAIVLSAAAVLGVAYWLYGGLLGRLLRLRADVPTPAVELRDDVDYVPIEPKFLLGQHFSAIAAAGPIVGPILAGAMFGWLPALIWILAGSILIGGVHDMTALVASVRFRARSITEVVRTHMSQRAFLMFLVFIWIALVYIIVAFTDITASSFVGIVELENGEKVAGAAIASSSLMYLALPIIMALLMRYAKLPLGWATAIFLPLVGLAIWGGKYIPFDLQAILGRDELQTAKAWDVILLVYCLIASLVPMWLLLQPRGHLGGYFLYAALIGGGLGLLFGGKTVLYPAFLGETAFGKPEGEPLFPMLFILIACGACSGFHALVASGTSSKQLKRETDAKIIGYGAMLLEGLVAIIALCCVMMLAQDDPIAKRGPNFIYANGLGQFLQVIGIPAALGVTFGLMAFTTFVYDTLDVCTRLGRYIIEELTGWSGTFGRVFATALTAGTPLYFVLQTATDATGKPVPAWKVFWSLFGASNQLLAALTLLGITVWLVHAYRARWAWIVTGLPMAWMYTMSMWALWLIARQKLLGADGRLHFSADPVPWVAIVLIVLGVVMLVEAILALTRTFTPLPPGGEPVPAAA